MTPAIGKETQKPLQSEKPVIESRPPPSYSENVGATDQARVYVTTVQGQGMDFVIMTHVRQ